MPIGMSFGDPICSPERVIVNIVCHIELIVYHIYGTVSDLSVLSGVTRGPMSIAALSLPRMWSPAKNEFITLPTMKGLSAYVRDYIFRYSIHLEN